MITTQLMFASIVIQARIGWPMAIGGGSKLGRRS